MQLLAIAGLANPALTNAITIAIQSETNVDGSNQNS
jgi:hypothetical protein